MKIVAAEITITIPIVVHSHEDVRKMVEHYSKILNCSYPNTSMKCTFKAKEVEVQL